MKRARVLEDYLTFGEAVQSHLMSLEPLEHVHTYAYTCFSLVS